MSIIQVNQIKSAIERRFRGLIDLSDIKGPQGEDDAFLTRGLAAFVVAVLCRIGDKEAADSVVDEFHDNGIDAVCFDAAERICYLVQSKWIKSGSGGVDVGSVLKFKEGVHDFFQGDENKFGEKMKKKWPEIEEILVDPKNRFVMVITYTSQQPLPTEANRPLEALIAALNDDTELVTFKALKQSDLYSVIAQQARGESVNLKIMLKQFGKIDDPYMAYYGQIDLKDIVAWGKYGDYLYAKNIRGFKGSTDVNDGIINTIRTNPQNFWYFNNGITITAERIIPQPLGSGTRESRVF